MEKEQPLLKIGLVTDIHYADANARGTRHYRESLQKMTEAVAEINKQKVDVAIEMGDLIDSLEKPTPESDLRFLGQINGLFRTIKGDKHYVFGNHCLETLTKAQFLAAIGRKKSFYSFDKKGFHIVVLDACYRADGVEYGKGDFQWSDTFIPGAERDWLAADLKKKQKKTLVFVHQRLDMPVGDPHGISSAPQVRQILEDSQKVIGVFMGHTHTNEHHILHNIPYITLGAMIEGSGSTNNAYSVLNVFAGGVMSLTGFRHHTEHPLMGKIF
jgi:predicted phosphohydrolase